VAVTEADGDSAHKIRLVGFAFMQLHRAVIIRCMLINLQTCSSNSSQSGVGAVENDQRLPCSIGKDHERIEQR